VKLPTKTNRLIYIIYFLLAFIGGYFVFRAMTWGPWAFSDSSAYVSAARNFASGFGFVIHQTTGELKILTEFPPFFSIILSIFGGNKLDYINTIRWLNIFLFSSSTLFVARIIFYSTRKHYLALLCAAFFISSPQIVIMYSGAMSEPLFLFLLLTSLVLYQRIFQKDKKLLQIAFFIISSLLPITRYAGILFVGIFGIGLFIDSQGTSLIRRFKDIALYYLLSFLPVTIWGFSLFHQFNLVGGKRFTFGNEIFLNMVRSIIEELIVVKFWIPYIEIYQDTFAETIIIFFVAVLIVFLIGSTIRQSISFNRGSDLNKKHFYFLVILLIIGYILFIGFTHSITIPQIDIIDRMMIPIYPLCIIIFFLSADILFNKRKREISSIVFIFIATLSLIGLRYNFLRTNSYIKTMQANGNGFTARTYQQSGLIKEIRKIPEDQAIISNSSGFVLFYTNRYPIQVNNFPKHAFGTGNSYGENSFRKNNAALIILFSDFSNYYGEESKSLLYSLTKTLQTKYIDVEGGIYYYQ